MKKILFCTAVLLLTTTANAQVYYRTSLPDVGFGKSADCATNPKMEFCVNGPLVGSDNLPVGGYIDNGICKKPWVDPVIGGGNFAVDNAIFGIGNDGHFYLLPYEEKDNLPPMKWAFQNGPILVKDGVNKRGTSTSNYTRSGIGFKNDTLVVIVSITPVTLRQFAELFIAEGCSNAIYLDGGPYVGYADKHSWGGTLVSSATKLQFFQKN